jgi:hypothetical protein
MFIDETQIRFLDDNQAETAFDAVTDSGDLLFTRYNGSAELVGVGAIYRGRKRFYPDKLIRVRLAPTMAEYRELVELAVNTSAGRKHIAASIKTTAGQQGLSGESLKATPIRIPSPLETKEILRRVSDALSAASDAQAALDAETADAAGSGNPSSKRPSRGGSSRRTRPTSLPRRCWRGWRRLQIARLVAPWGGSAKRLPRNDILSMIYRISFYGNCHADRQMGQ